MNRHVDARHPNPPATTAGAAAVTSPAPWARRLCAALAATLAAVLFTACGGGDDGLAPDPAPTPVDAGPPVTATVGPAGGEIRFMASGVAGRLQIPSGLLDGDRAITVTPRAAAAGEWARLDISGVDAVLERPATLTLTLPAGSTLDPAAAVTQAGSERNVLLPGTLDRAAREISVGVQRFGRGATARALSARRQEVLPVDPGTLILVQSLLVRARVAIAEAQFRALQLLGSFGTAVELSTSIAALIQSSGLDGYEAEARPWLDRAGSSACAELGQSIEQARAAQAPSELDPEGSIANAHVTRISAPVLRWAGIVDGLGASCPGLDPQAALSQVHQRVLSVVEAKLRARQDAATIRGAVGEAAAAKALYREGQALDAVRGAAPRAADRSMALHAADAAGGTSRRLAGGTSAATLGAQVRDEVMVPALAPLRAAHWQAASADATQDHYRYSLAVFGASGPLADDLQLAATTVNVRSYRDAAATQLEGEAALGRRTTPQESIRAWTVSAKSGGRVTLDGPIDVLRCPAAASEQMAVEFEGREVLNRPSSGDRLLQGRLDFDIDRLLDAAGIRPADATQHVLRVWRRGSSCNGSFGVGDATVVEITLDFSKTCRPAPGVSHCVETLRDAQGQALTGWAPRWLAEDGSLLLARRGGVVPGGVFSAIWKSGTLTTLPAGFEAASVNAASLLAGVLATVNATTGELEFRAALWRDGNWIYLGPPRSSFNDVNDAGTAVGTYSSGGWSPSLRYENGQPRLGALGANSALRTVNSRGEACSDFPNDPGSKLCAWINEHGHAATEPTAAGARNILVLNNGTVLRGAEGFVRVGVRHAAARWNDGGTLRGEVVDMSSGTTVTLAPDARSGVSAAHLALSLVVGRGDSRGRFVADLMHGLGPGTPPEDRLLWVIPAGVERR